MIVVCWGLMLLSTIFQSVSGCDRELNAHFCSAASLKSKKISNDQELIQSDPISQLPSNPEGK